MAIFENAALEGAGQWFAERKPPAKWAAVLFRQTGGEYHHAQKSESRHGGLQPVTLPQGDQPSIKGGWFLMLFHHKPVHEYYSAMALNFITAIWAFGVCCAVTVVVSLATARTKTDGDLQGLVYALTPRISDEHPSWYARPGFLGVLILIAMVILTVIFW